MSDGTIEYIVLGDTDSETETDPTPAAPLPEPTAGLGCKRPSPDAGGGSAGPAPKKARGCTFAKRADSTLRLHRDPVADECGLRGALNAMPQGKTANGTAAPGLVIVPGSMADMPTAAGKFVKVGPEEQADCEAAAEVVVAPAGSFTFWSDSAVHGNAGSGHTLPTTAVSTVTLQQVLSNPDLVHTLVKRHGYCVVTGVLDPTECDAMVAAARTAVWASVAPSFMLCPFTMKFKGAGGTGLWKHWGVSAHEDLRPFSVHPNILRLWRAVLRTEDICFSPDALAFTCELNAAGGHDIDRPTRVTQILCFGCSDNQAPGTGEQKLAYYLDGGSCNHPPCLFSKGGSGRHYSDAKREWKVQRPTWGKDPEVDALFTKLLGP